MTFFAKLKRTSSIWHDWISSRRTGGLVAGVYFRRTGMNDYETNSLRPEDIIALKDHTAVTMEVITNIDQPMMEPNQEELDRLFEESLRAPEPVPEVAPAPEPEDARKPPPRPVPEAPKPPPPPKQEQDRSSRYNYPQRSNRGRR